MLPSFSPPVPILPLFFLIILPFMVQAASASSKPIFQFVNEGDLNMYSGEYSSTFRSVRGIDTPDRMGLFFYNNTPNTYTLAVGVGFIPLWVWAANRNNPVRDGATLTLQKDDNLVLADANSDIVWQTNTATKGVVGIKLLDTGNLVLYNDKGKYIWQSFDHSLMVGQSLWARSASKLVSRASNKSSQEGSCALIMRPNGLSLYYNNPQSSRLLQYYTMIHTSTSTLSEVKLSTFMLDDQVYELHLDYSSLDGETGGSYVFATTKYNSTFSFIRLDYDGNVRIYTYFDKTPDGIWSVEFILFNKDNSPFSAGLETKCQLPERCGNFGVCYKDQCVACPSPKGLLGRSEACQPPRLGACSGGKRVKYFDIEGIEHFTSKYTKGEGPIKETECGNKCSKDCKCLGYFYHQETSRCWITYDLKTLTRSGNSKHVAYIKTSN